MIAGPGCLAAWRPVTFCGGQCLAVVSLWRPSPVEIRSFVRKIDARRLQICDLCTESRLEGFDLWSNGWVHWRAGGLEWIRRLERHLTYSIFKGGRRIITNGILNAVDISCTAVSPMAVYMSRQGLDFFIRFV